MNFTKVAHQSVKYQKKFDCLGEISPNLYLDRLLLLKVYKISAKNYRRVMSHDTKDWCKIWRKTVLLFQKWREFNEFWSEHSKVSKIRTSIGPFCTKHITFDLKKYWGVFFHGTEESCKIWRNTGLWFGKWHEKFDKFWPEYSKISQICTLMGCFWPKYIMFELSKYRGVMFIDTQDWWKTWRKNDLCFQKWHEEFGKFSPPYIRKSKNWDFYLVLLSKVENVWA